MNQDFVTWVGQGRIADRSREHLGPSDQGIVMIRRRFLRDLEAIARGEDPKGVIRDPALNRAIRLPVADRQPLDDGLTRAEMLRDPLSRRGLEGYVFQTGQPPEVREAFLAAMGFNGAEFARSGDPFDLLAPAPR
jgi:5,5'-dehydrodivanillate O-demethylase oxygenase subunit